MVMPLNVDWESGSKEGSGLHCGHTPSCRRYVGVALVVVVSAGSLESALFLAGFLESATP